MTKSLSILKDNPPQHVLTIFREQSFKTLRLFPTNDYLFILTERIEKNKIKIKSAALQHQYEEQYSKIN